MAFSCYNTHLSSMKPVGLNLCLAHFEALDPPLCLPFGAHCVMEEVTGRTASLGTLLLMYLPQSTQSVAIVSVILET